MLPLAGILLILSFFTGGSAAAGWTSYAPLTEDRPLSSVGPGQDLWIVAIVLIGTSSILGAVNFLVTIFKMRAPGMTLFRMPIMVWTVLTTSVLGLLATPVITSALIMLFIDRNYGGSFFDLRNGGDAILYQNVFWFYSHPAVYIMVLPAMGMISEILPVFSRKPLSGTRRSSSRLRASAPSGSRCAHHMFTTGAVYLPFFSLMTFLIAVPTGVKMFNWIFTLWRGKLNRRRRCSRARLPEHVPDRRHQRRVQRRRPGRLRAPRMTRTVAHLHYVLFGGSVFGVMAGLYYWFPKMTGRMLNEGLGKIQFVLMFIGFNLTFFPMHQLGLAGMPRRIADYASGAGWNDLNIAATVGGFLIATSMVPLLWNVFVSLRSGKPAGDDPWEGNTLEWATSCRHRRTTSTVCPRSGPSGRCSTSATDRRTGRSRPYPSRRARADAMAIDDHALTTTEHSPVAGLAHDARGGISNVVLGMLLFITSEVMFFAGLFAAYFNVRANALRGRL